MKTEKCHERSRGVPNSKSGDAAAVAGSQNIQLFVDPLQCCATVTMTATVDFPIDTSRSLNPARLEALSKSSTGGCLVRFSEQPSNFHGKVVAKTSRLLSRGDWLYGSLA